MPLSNFKRGVIALLLAISILTSSEKAHATYSDGSTFIWMALYGMAAGTLMGLVAAPITQSGRSIFIGTSVGLYLGTAVSIYHFTHRYDPENPISPANPDYGQGIRNSAPGFQPIIAFSVPIATF